MSSRKRPPSVKAVVDMALKGTETGKPKVVKEPKRKPGTAQAAAAVARRSKPTIGQLKDQITDLQYQKDHYRSLYYAEKDRSEQLQALLDAAGAALLRKRDLDQIPF